MLTCLISFVEHFEVHECREYTNLKRIKLFVFIRALAAYFIKSITHKADIYVTGNMSYVYTNVRQNKKLYKMRKILLLTLTLSGLLFACQDNENEVKETELVNIENADNTEKIELIFGEFKTLYNELLDFKDKSDFKTNGFGKGGPYHKWLTKVENLKNDPNSKLLLQKDVVAGELEQLGLAYASSRGEETEVTKSFNKIFSNAISSKPIEKVETASGNSNYDKLKTDYELFGKWKITNTTVKSSYPYEIYKKGDEYIGVIPKDEFKTEILEKKGIKYFVKGNKYGEYYMINSNMEMTLFDKDGELASMGYKATKE